MATAARQTPSTVGLWASTVRLRLLIGLHWAARVPTGDAQLTGLVVPAPPALVLCRLDAIVADGPMAAQATGQLDTDV